MNEVRAMLCEEIEKLRKKETTPAQANAVANLTGKVFTSLKLDLEYARLANKTPSNQFIQLEEKATISAPKAA